MSSIDDNENERKIDEYIARKSRVVSAREFEGNGKILVFNSKRVKPDHPTKFGPAVQYIVKEMSGIEREVNATAISLITGIRSRLKEKPPGTDVSLLVRKTGVGSDVRYLTEHATASS